MTKITLTFWGGIALKHRRNFATINAAKAEALRVLAKVDNRAAHPAVIYDEAKSQPVLTVR